jgi:Xaa-Pro dipeptidase
VSDATPPVDTLEEQRVADLRNAQIKAERLFREIEDRGLIRSGISESRLNADIYELAKEMYGITTYWHKRIIRAGRNTLAPYAENPPDLTIGQDDILFLDLGPVFEDWEADFGRTFVVGSDPQKLKLRDDVGAAYAEGKRYFEQTLRSHSEPVFCVCGFSCAQIWLGIRRPDCRASHRPIPARKDCGR